MSDALFHLKLLANYQLVTKPGTYYVSVAYTVHESNLNVSGVNPRYIVPFRAMTGEGLQDILEVLKTSGGSTVPYSDISRCFLSGSLWCEGSELFDESDLPIKGEKVLATFDYVDTNFGRRLLCTHLELLPREELSYIDIDQVDQFRLTLNNLITKSIN